MRLGQFALVRLERTETADDLQEGIVLPFQRAATFHRTNEQIGALLLIDDGNASRRRTGHHGRGTLQAGLLQAFLVSQATARPLAQVLKRGKPAILLHQLHADVGRLVRSIANQCGGLIEHAPAGGEAQREVQLAMVEVAPAQDSGGFRVAER
ncbi:hypothetical protein D3C80_1345990 [compost metagenome]